MYFGSAWYPEHWDEASWDEDLRLMRAAGMNVVRVGEFAWSRLEPEEGRFEFDWLERTITLAARHELAVVVGTPSAAPPAWLTQRYPETLGVDESGQRRTHGNRAHFSFTSARYRAFCHRIAEALAWRFGTNTQVIGWQIDNEYSAISYDDETRGQFQAWLQRRYETLDVLNARWTTAYWSQEYSGWTQISIPIGSHNPGLMLDWRRFVTASYCEYQREQVHAIRAHADKRQWITHNYIGWLDTFDHYVVSDDLDMVSWDNYVGAGHLQYQSNGYMHDLMRGFKRRNFWVMETQPGNVNWAGLNNVLDRGAARAMAWHAIGHGADGLLYWQWRSALGGQEQYHGSLLAPDGRPRPFYHEAAQIGNELARVADVLRDTLPVAQAALLHSYEDRWAIDFQRHHRDFDPTVAMLNFYGPLREHIQAVDVVQPSAPLENYRLIVAPYLHLLNEGQASHLLEYVQRGGHLVLGARSGMKDEFNALLPMRQPGPLAKALGAHVEEYYALDKPITVSGVLGDGEAKIWAEWLHVDTPDADVLLSYNPSNGWLDGQAAVVTRVVGGGRITYVGAWFDDQLMQKLMIWLVGVSAVHPVFGVVPKSVEVCQRSAGERQVTIVINHTREPQQIALPRPLYDALTEATYQVQLGLPAYGVALLLG